MEVDYRRRDIGQHIFVYCDEEQGHESIRSSDFDTFLRMRSAEYPCQYLTELAYPSRQNPRVYS